MEHYNFNCLFNKTTVAYCSKSELYFGSPMQWVRNSLSPECPNFWSAGSRTSLGTLMVSVPWKHESIDSSFSSVQNSINSWESFLRMWTKTNGAVMLPLKRQMFTVTSTGMPLAVSIFLHAFSTQIRAEFSIFSDGRKTSTGKRVSFAEYFLRQLSLQCLITSPLSSRVVSPGTKCCSKQVLQSWLQYQQLPPLHLWSKDWRGRSSHWILQNFKMQKR